MDKFVVKKGYSIAWNDRTFNAGDEIPYNKDFDNYIEKIEMKMLDEELPKKRSKK